MQPKAALSSQQAADFLGVKPQTLYAYASRGLLGRVGDSKHRQYLVEDLERLRLRQRARSGHGPVAAAALSFGYPVLDTRITEIDPERGPLYRGRAALELAARGVSFEAAAELLWSGALPSHTQAWRPLPHHSRAACTSLEALLCALPALVQAAPERHLRTPEAERALARSLIRSVAELSCDGRGRPGQSIAELLAGRATLEDGKAARAALDAALVLLADHELNASSFTARVAASTDANLPCCVIAALATLSGPRHGGACDRVEALLDEAEGLAQPGAVVERRARRGELLPGFGHPLYPQGDPRGRLLLERTARIAKRSPRARKRSRAALTLSRSLARQGLPASVDFGLVALTRALGMPAGSAALLFALGRCAGWVAHVLEQRGSTAVLRPRARYVSA
jgi:citrate synthase